MARISGVTIPDNKQVLYSLTYVHGIGLKTSGDILSQASIEPDSQGKRPD
jgi:small subunit ribosomal protein S13